MYLYFPSLGTWITGDGTLRYFFSPSTIPERASNGAIVEKPGCTHSHYKARSADSISKNTHIKPGAMNGTASSFMGSTGIQALFYCSDICIHIAA